MRVPPEPKAPAAAPASTSDELPPNLPSNWRPVEALRALLPRHLDYRVYAPVVHAPLRYAVRIDGGAENVVWDIGRQCALKPIRGSKQPDRIRYRINDGETVRRLYLSRMVAAAVLGAPRNYRDRKRSQEAHHKDGAISNNAATNLQWLSRKEHMELERKRGTWTQRATGLKTQQSGAKNTNAKLDFKDLVSLFKAWNWGRTSLRQLGDDFGISAAQAQRLIQGKSRIEEARSACAMSGIKPFPPWLIIK